MITPNSKLTALEVLTECGVKDAEAVFGTMRVRIGGISGINTPDHLINIPASAEVLEVIVGSDVYDLTLAKGNKSDNAEIRTISEDAKAVIEERGVELTEKAEKLQEVKKIARLMRDGGVFTPKNKADEEMLEQARALNESHDEAIALAEEAKAERQRIAVKSK